MSTRKKPAITLRDRYVGFQAGSFKVHRRTHDLDPLVRRPFPCSVPGCAFRAATADYLRSHLASSRHIPKPKKEFHCPMCPKVTCSHLGVASHVNSAHIKENLFQRASADFRAHKHSNLDLLFKTRQKTERFFKCNFAAPCNYTTKYSSSLKRHVATHVRLRTADTTPTLSVNNYKGCHQLSTLKLKAWNALPVVRLQRVSIQIL